MEHGAKGFHGPPVGATSAASDVNAPGLQHTQACRQGVVTHQIEKHIEARAPMDEVFASVVDDMVRAKGPHKLDVPRAAHSSDAGLK
jgi:hypothetical protein